MYFSIENLCYSTGKFALNEISFSLRKNEYYILLGKSGSGKTTLLRCITGINKVKNSRIILNERNIANLEPEERNIAYVPQNYALFPHLTVKENIIYGMNARKFAQRKISRKLDEVTDLFDISSLLNRNISTLSGGEKQKTAICRALAIEPDLILLDEPFSSIDEGTKRGLWLNIKNIIIKTGITAIHITHNLDEAFTVGEKFGILINGSLVQTGTKNDLLTSPRNNSVAKLLNYNNIYPAEITNKISGKYMVKTENFNIRIDSKRILPEKIQLCIRPQDIKIIKQGEPLRQELTDNVYSGTIINLNNLGETATIYFKIDNSSALYDFEISLPAYICQRYNLSEGKKINAAVWQPGIIVLE